MARVGATWITLARQFSSRKDFIRGGGVEQQRAARHGAVRGGEQAVRGKIRDDETRALLREPVDRRRRIVALGELGVDGHRNSDW